MSEVAEKPGARTALASSAPRNAPGKADVGPVSFSISPAALAVWEQVERLGLFRHIAELEVKGYTIIPPEKIGPPEFIAELRERLFDVVERRTGTRPNVETGALRLPSETLNESYKVAGLNSAYLLFEDPIFQKAAVNETVLAIVDYLIGKSANLTTCLSLIKGQGEDDLALHIDSVITPPPLSPHQQFCNVTWALTDYSRENGALCFAPGSHKYLRAPMPGEGIADRVAVEAPAGSVIIWPGSTWHGAFARKAPGLRANVIFQYIRPHIRPLEPYRENVTPEILAANPPRFATLVGQELNHGWKEEGPQRESTAYKRGRHAYD
jgi:ectoine hydroxylase-related dioxygenase (phytanoyl-CoA dioxygenase family)